MSRSTNSRAMTGSTEAPAFAQDKSLMLVALQLRVISSLCWLLCATWRGTMARSDCGVDVVLTCNLTVGRGANTCSVRRRARTHTPRDQDIKGRWLPETTRYASRTHDRKGQLLSAYRYTHRVDGGQCYGHGPQLPGARGLCRHMVSVRKQVGDPHKIADRF